MARDDIDGPELNALRLRGGIWEGQLSNWIGDTPPVLYLMRGPTVMAEAQLSSLEPGIWHVTIALPGALIGDGAQSFAIMAEGGSAPLAQIVVIAGDVLADDLRADLATLREEVEVLKRAFRRHVRQMREG